MKFALLSLAFVSIHAFAQVEIDAPWSRATPPGAKIAVGYMVIKNNGSTPDRLLGASSPLAAKVETHVTKREGDVMKMREVKGYDVPARGSYALKPNGAHLMLVGIKRPLKDGDKVPLVLRFEKAGEVKTELAVRASAPAPGGMDMNHMEMKR